jgi:hypothetical protein
MNPDTRLTIWEASGSVKDATYDEAKALLEHHGFTVSKRTHTNFWSHPLLEGHPRFASGFFALTRPHGKGGTKAKLHSSDVRKVVDAVTWVKTELEEQVRLEEEEEK